MNKDFDKIDEMAHEAFQNYEVDFNPEDWSLMEAKLDKKEHRIAHIWMYKGIEALLLVLILFTAINFWTLQDNNSLSAIEETDKELINLPEQETTNSNFIKEENAVDEISNKESGTSANGVENFAGHETILPKTSQNNNDHNQTTTRHTNHINNSFAGHNSAVTHTKSKNAALSTLNTNTIKNSGIDHTDHQKGNANGSAALKTLALGQNTGSNEKLFAENSSTSIIAPLDITKTKIVDHNGGGKEEGTAINIESNFKFPKIYHRQLRIGVYSGAEVNLSNSMGDARLGMAFGVMLENEISDRFAIRSGLVISRKNYENTYTRIIDRTATEGILYQSEIYKKTALGTIQIPVALNVIAYRDSKWKLSFNAGVAAQFLTHRHVSGTQRTRLYQQAGGMVSIVEINPNTQEKGAWQGGLMSTNTYFVGAVGFELERRLGDRVSLFIQPVYQHDFTPVGNAQDIIHTVSVNVGLKTIVK